MDSKMLPVQYLINKTAGNIYNLTIKVKTTVPQGFVSKD